MPKIFNVRLIVDASIAGSAGKIEHPVSKACRDTLDIIIRNSYILVMTPDIYTEWMNHTSKFSLTWLASMKARKRILRLNNSVIEKLRNKLMKANFTEKDMAAMMKDVHLIEAALTTDNIIISRDDIARGLFVIVSKRVGEIRQVIWTNPVHEDEQTIVWLENGAFFDKLRCIGFQA